MRLALAVAFGNGVLSFAAPCTVSLLPAYLAILSGASADAGVHANTNAAAHQRIDRVVAGSAAFAVGLSLVYLLLGLKAGSAAGVRLSGATAQRNGGSLVLVVALLLLALALRNRWTGDRNRWQRLLGPLAFGLASAAAYIPCASPFLATALALAANTSDPLPGAALLTAYALGIAVPFLLAAMGVAGSQRLGRRLARARAVLLFIAAAVLAILGLLLVTGRYDVLSGWLSGLVIVSA